MDVEVLKTPGYYQIRIPLKERYTNQHIRKFMDYLKIKNNAKKSTATDIDIENLSEEIMEEWWEKNKNSYAQD